MCIRDSEYLPPLPTASGSFGDKPVLAFPDTPAPADLGVQVLVHGDGDVVEAGDDIEVNYFGQVWGGRVFDTSYDRGASISCLLYTSPSPRDRTSSRMP